MLLYNYILYRSKPTTYSMQLTSKSSNAAKHHMLKQTATATTIKRFFGN